MKKKHNIDIHFVGIITVLVILVIALISGTVIGVVGSYNDHTYTITVTGKERVNDKNDSKYLIYGINEEGQSYVLENTDSLLRGKFNSSEIYGSIEKGKKYKTMVVGYRVPFLSLYENIIEYKEIKE